jgi:hypothetical protein
VSLFGPIPDKYADIDAELDRWAAVHGLRWFKEYKDHSVRSLDYPSSENRVVQLYLEPPEGRRIRVVTAREYKGGTQQMSIVLRHLETALDDALDQARRWTAE